jgi:hypothetical protein
MKVATSAAGSPGLLLIIRLRQAAATGDAGQGRRSTWGTLPAAPRGFSPTQPRRDSMRQLLVSAALATGLLFLAPTDATAAAPEAAAQADAGYGARSLRGMKEAYVEVLDEAQDTAADTKSSGDDLNKLLKDLMQQGSSKTSRADKLKADVLAALSARTAITPRFNSVDEARAAGAPILSIQVLSRGSGSGGNAPFDITLSVRQQVALSRDPKLTFYATTYDMSVSEPADGRGKRKVLAEVMDKFTELWRAAN